jgi:hypothetical protein
VRSGDRREIRTVNLGLGRPRSFESFASEFFFSLLTVFCPGRIGLCCVTPMCWLERIFAEVRSPCLIRKRTSSESLFGLTVRDRLCPSHLPASTGIRILVKSHAIDFCAVKTLKEATREQVENFVAHLAGWAERDRNALLFSSTVISGQKEGAA